MTDPDRGPPPRSTAAADPTLDPRPQLAATLSSGGGKHCSRVLLSDIAGRKRAEDALRESEERLRLFVEHAPASLAMFDLEMRYLLASRQWKADYGLGERELHGLSHYEVVPEIPQRWKDAHRLGLAGEVVRAEAERVERADGSVQWLRWEVRPWRDTRGEVGGIVIFSADITELMQAEAELRRLNEELEERVRARTAALDALVERAQSADRLKSAFLATMNHELRTPLNSILGFTGLLLQGLPGPLNDEQTKQLGMVRGSARHLLSLINDILDLSKIEAGEFTVEEEAFDLRPVLEGAAASVMPLAHRKGLTLDVRVSPEVGEVVSDARRVEQVLLNLLTNAVKFTERGSVTVAAEVVSECPGTRTKTSDSGASPLPQERPAVRIRVADEGIGIRPEDLEGLFQPFQQLDAGLDRRQEGTGLGLAICRKLAALLGGEIRAESRWGQGSTFTFVLPVKRGKSP